MRATLLSLMLALAVHPTALDGESGAEPLSPELEQLDVVALERVAATGRGAERVVALTRLAALGAHAEPVRALEHALEAVALAHRNQDRRGEMGARYIEGYIRRNLAAYPEALDAIEASTTLAIALGDERALASGYDLLGLTLFRVGMIDDALGAHLDAFAIREQLGDREGLAYSHNNLGNAYRRLGDYARATEHHLRALALKQELGYRGSLAYSHENLGDVYRAMAQWDLALASYERARQIQVEIADPSGLASVLTGIGIVRQRRGEAAVAVDLFEQALALWRRADDVHGEAVAHLNLGRAHAALAHPDLADRSLRLALATFERIAARLRAVETLEALAEFEAARGRPAEALAFLQRARDEQRATPATDIARRLAQARRAWRRALELEARRRERDALAAVALLAVALVVAVSYAYRQRRGSERRYRAKAEALEKALSETRTLRGLLPLCASCKRIRDDAGYWEELETYIRDRSEAEFTHGLCPRCAGRYFPDDDGGAAPDAPARVREEDPARGV